MTRHPLLRVSAAAVLAAALASCTDAGSSVLVQRDSGVPESQPAADPMEALVARAASPMTSVREAALREAETATPHSRTCALRLVASRDALLRRGAANVLARVADADCTSGVVCALKAADEVSVPALLAALGRTQTAVAGAALVDEVVGPNEHRASAAAGVLESFRGPLDLARLRDAVKPGRAPHTRQGALAVLAARLEPQDVATFRELASDPSPTVRAAAASGLVASGQATADEVRRLVLEDPHESVRTAAARAAAKAPLAVVLEPLREALATLKDDDAVPAALRSLAAHREPAAFDALLEFVRDDTQSVDLRIIAARGLAAIDARRAAEILKRESAVFDTELRAECEQILAAAEPR